MDNYKLKYVKISADEIFNLCDAMYIPEFCQIPSFWDDENLRQHLRSRYIEEFNKHVGHYEKLEEDLLNEGFRNPILVTAGKPRWRVLTDLPPMMRTWREEDLLICEVNGGSRLTIAQKYGSDVPCIVSDFVNKFPEESEITIKDAYKTFRDPPGNLKMTSRGLQIVAAQYTHINDPNYTVSEQSKARRNIINHILSELNIDPSLVRKQLPKEEKTDSYSVFTKQNRLIHNLKRFRG